MKNSSSELLEITARTTQLIIVLEILDHCETVDEVRKIIQEQAAINSQVITEALNGLTKS
ncbi:MAG: hypothetical protein LBN97_01430 [Oscillospiraceae bacterium]|jgi:hypothetical protein|nr:hypothetical protein [Oscillospiraceae bacterium]